MIRVSFSLFLSLSVFCYFTLLLVFMKIILLVLLLLLLIFFFMKVIFIFSCSGMFRNVPECSMFQVLSTPILIHGSTQIIRQSHSIDSNVDLFMYLIEAEGLGSVC